jgi:hypothetical protein
MEAPTAAAAPDAALATLLRVGAHEYDLFVLMKELASFNISIQNQRIYIRIMVNGKNKDCLLLHEITGKFRQQTLDYLRGTRQLEGARGMLPFALEFLKNQLDLELAYERNERLRLAAAI